jgi:sugar/nucleoside kinase (ribokinase family)
VNLASVLVVGSVALDTVITPTGEVKDVLGGSASYFSYAASFFTSVKLVAVVGEDFSQEYIDLLRSRNIDLGGLRVERGKTFRWGGRYRGDMSVAETLYTDLNVFENFSPDIPDEYKRSEYLFLANIDPELQLNILNQMEKPKLVACDTMNYWINNEWDALMEIIKRVDVLIVNDAEVRAIGGETNLISAASRILCLGPKAIIIKKGEHGAMLFREDCFFYSPAYPLPKVVDPTGAGDSFAGGFMGYMAKTEGNNIQRAIVYGNAMGSFCVEDFGLRRFQILNNGEIEERFKEFQQMVSF